MTNKNTFFINFDGLAIGAIVSGVCLILSFYVGNFFQLLELMYAKILLLFVARSALIGSLLFVIVGKGSRLKKNFFLVFVLYLIIYVLAIIGHALDSKLFILPIFAGVIFLLLVINKCKRENLISNINIKDSYNLEKNKPNAIYTMIILLNIFMLSLPSLIDLGRIAIVVIVVISNLLNMIAAIVALKKINICFHRCKSFCIFALLTFILSLGVCLLDIEKAYNIYSLMIIASTYQPYIEMAFKYNDIWRNMCEIRFLRK